MFARNCPNCKNQISYKYEITHIRGVRKNSWCRGCVTRRGFARRQKENPKPEFYIRNCPECKKELKHTYYYSWKNGLEKQILCRGCVQRGERHKYFGGKNYPNTTREISRQRLLKSNPGKNKSLETCKKISESLKKSITHKLVIEKKRGIPRSAEVKKKIRKAIIKDLQQKYGFQLSPNYNKIACKLFDKLNMELGWNGRHAENGGELHLKELGYWVDYYEPQYNVVIEYDEKRHRQQKEKDQQRQQEIQKYLKCIFIRISEETPNKLNLLKEQLQNCVPCEKQFYGEYGIRKYPVLLSPNNQRIEITNMTKFAKEKNLVQQCLSKLVNGQIKQYRGWRLA